jgi:hypothetical protein
MANDQWDAMVNTIRQVGQAGRVCTSSDAQEEYRKTDAGRKEHLFLGLDFLLFRRRSLFHLDSPGTLLRLLCQLPRLALTLRLNAFLFSNSQQKKHHSRCLRKVASYHCSSRLIVHHYRSRSLAFRPLALGLTQLFIPIHLYRIYFTISRSSRLRRRLFCSPFRASFLNFMRCSSCTSNTAFMASSSTRCVLTSPTTSATLL